MGSGITGHRYHRSDISTFIQEEPDEIQVKMEHQSGLNLRPKRAFRGRAFPCFGNIVPPLFASNIFPMAPKQEKMYFNVASDTNIDHFDGELDSSFLDDIRTFMQPILDSFMPESQNSNKFLVRRDNPNFVGQWATKFPLASHRILEYNHAHANPIEIERHAGAEFSSENYDHEFGADPKMVLMSGISKAHGGLKTNNVEMVNMADLELRMAQTSLTNIFESVERPDMESDFQLRFQKFESKVAHFTKVAENWPRPHGFLGKVRELSNIESFKLFEEWLMVEKETLADLNMLHELWMASGLARRIITPTKAIRIGHWMTVFFQYTTFKANRPMVRNV